MSHGLEFRISDMEQQTKGLGVGLRQTVDSLFQSDDKLLSSLQKLGWELETEDPEEQESIRKLRDICARLIKYTVEAIRTKLDRVYLEALESSQRSGDRSRVSQDDMALLQEEVESLYSEILPVAQMSVEQQYLEPALKSLAAKNGESQSRSAAAVTYVSITLLKFGSILILRRSTHALTIYSNTSRYFPLGSKRSKVTRLQLALFSPQRRPRFQ